MSGKTKCTSGSYVGPERPIRQYDMWHDGRLAFPNDLIRGSLFAVSKRTELEREIATQDGLTIRYKGVPLDQSHLDIFAAVTYLARGLHADATVQTSRYELLGIMGWKSNEAGAKGFDWIWRRLSDLVAGTIMVEQHRRKIATGSLLSAIAIDEGTDRISVTFNPLVRPLFDFATHLRPSERHRLSSPLDKWLLAFLCSNTWTFPMHIETYRELSGSTALPKEFTRQIKASLARLKRHRFIDSWEISRTLVKIEREPTRAQIRHFIRGSHSKKKTSDECPF